MEDIVSRLENVQHLTIDGRISSRVLDDLPSKISKYMPQLKTIDLFGCAENLDIIELVEGLNLPMLESFRMHGSFNGENGNPRSADKVRGPVGSIRSLRLQVLISDGRISSV